MGHSSDWDEVRAGLVGYQTDALNLAAAENWSASIEQLAGAVAESSVLVGYSMGARLALGLALADPQRYRGLIFISGNPGLESTEERDSRKIVDERIAQEIENGSLEPFLHRWYLNEVFASLSPQQRQSEIARKLGHAADGSKRWPAILRANSVSQQPNFWPELQSLQIPTLAIAGELDPKYESIVQRMGRESSRLTTHIVPACGHIVHREQPKDLAELIRAFCDSVEK